MNSLIPHTFCVRAARKSLVATAFLAALFSLGVAAFAQDDQNGPPPPPPQQQSDQQPGQTSEPGMGRHMGQHQMPSVDDQLKHLSKKLNLSDDQIKSVLNADQQKNFDKMREQQHERMKNWRKGGENAPPAGDNQ